MGIENSNQGPGWHDHDTPYGTIHSYDGDTGTYGGGGTGGNAGGGHTGLTANTWVDIATTKDYNGRIEIFYNQSLNSYHHNPFAFWFRYHSPIEIRKVIKIKKK